MGQPHKYIGFFYFTSKSACALQRRKDLSPTTMCYFLAITVGLAIAAMFFLAALLAGCGVENELLACGHAAAWPQVRHPTKRPPKLRRGATRCGREGVNQMRP